jgi:DNA helicase IV
MDSVGTLVDLEVERAALEDARVAAREKLDRLSGVSGLAADEYSEGFINAVVAATMEQLQRELTVFGRIDDDHPWRIGLFGIDRGGEQLVVDWRARFAEGFYQATSADPMGLERRVSYVGCIDDLMIEELLTGEVSGTSPLMAELSRSRGPAMRTAVATLQAEQDRLVRLDPAARLVLRGGPGTGKTVVGLHRAAWLVYNDSRITSDRILILGPSERFLQFVSTVLPTLGESRIVQTTFERHLRGPATAIGGDERWLDVIDRLEASLITPRDLRVRGRLLPEAEVVELVDRVTSRALPWRERRAIVLSRLVHHFEAPKAEVERALREVFPAVGASAAWRKLRSPATLRSLGVDDAFIAAWRTVDDDGPLRDEVRARFEGIATKYSHVIVDEAQDMSLFQLRAVQRRADGLTLVGDDAQRSAPGAIGLHTAARHLAAPLEEMATAYRMSAEIADWLNAHAARHDLEAVELLGVRPTGVDVTLSADREAAASSLRERWEHVAVIGADDVWEHKGVEYDAVVVDRRDMSPSEVYLAASRAAHQLVLVGS